MSSFKSALAFDDLWIVLGISAFNSFYNVILICRLALENFERCVRPGGLLLIDHRNFDAIVDTGETPSKGIYYNVSAILIRY